MTWTDNERTSVVLNLLSYKIDARDVGKSVGCPNT